MSVDKCCKRVGLVLSVAMDGNSGEVTGCCRSSGKNMISSVVLSCSDICVGTSEEVYCIGISVDFVVVVVIVIGVAVGLSCFWAVRMRCRYLRVAVVL